MNKKKLFTISHLLISKYAKQKKIYFIKYASNFSYSLKN